MWNEMTDENTLGGFIQPTHRYKNPTGIRLFVLMSFFHDFICSSPPTVGQTKDLNRAVMSEMNTLIYDSWSFLAKTKVWSIYARVFLWTGF